MTDPHTPDVRHLRRGGTSVVVDVAAPGCPVIAYWGPDLGELGADVLESLSRAQRPQRVSGGLDATPLPSVVPIPAQGWFGVPGLEGSRDGTAFSPALGVVDVRGDGTSLAVTAADRVAGLELTWTAGVDPAGLLTQRIRLRNTGSDAYRLDVLTTSFPLPPTASEVLDTTGRHLRERFPQRHALTTGVHTRESRRGRPGADATLLLLAGTSGFGFERGLVHGVHLAWSGNHRLAIERTPMGATLLQAGELLGPGEIILAPDETYETPAAIGSWGEGLNQLSARFHRAVRARPQHPRRLRPVTLNTWEAVYFDLSTERLVDLADLAAAVGIERFVIDDGWFRGRRDDTAGLGDWYVDTAVFPDGLTPVAEHVAGLGMELGLWVEPEMVNLDSDLARQHPDWLLQPAGRLPLPGRQQQVLNLAHPDAYAYLLERLDALVTEYSIGYLKWDHNRDLLDAGSTLTGRLAVHDQTLALYRLLEELKGLHPGLEIESCASGGARVDLGILAHTDRVWTSDCIDPIERLPNQRYTGLVLPPELMGMHIGSPTAHTTGRTHDLPLRAGTALFGHLGVEWDLRDLTAAELADVRAWIETHKRLRDLLHAGTVVHGDLADPGADLRGVVAADGSRALFCFTQVTSSATHPPQAITFPGLDPDATYTVRRVGPGVGAEISAEVGSGDVHSGDVGQSALAWTQRTTTLTGRAAGLAGLRPPVLMPERLALIAFDRVER